MDDTASSGYTLYVWHRNNKDGADVPRARGSVEQMKQYFALHADAISMMAVWYPDPQGEIRGIDGAPVLRFDNDKWREVTR